MKAIIMGATSGIGLEVAKLLAGKGWQLALAGRRMEILAELQQSMPNVGAIRKIDITDPPFPLQASEVQPSPYT